MYWDKVSFSTDVIPIIDAYGKKVDEIHLKEKVKPMQRRRCCISNQGIYYKGAGIIYTGHFVNEHNDKLKVVSKTKCMYEKYNVINPLLYRKFGIFEFRHQPCFSDCEGGCGRKEKNIVEMQKKFKYSAIEEIVDIIDVPLKDHAIYAYAIKNLSGSYKNTLDLIEYILCENYNTAWDKNVWDDIMCFGYVRDLADWFVSDRFSHKLGTMYALLNSLVKKDKYLYEEIIRSLTGLEQLGDYHIIYLAALIVRKFCDKCTANVDLEELSSELYTNLWEQLYTGKACCHLEDNAEWDYLRDYWKKNIPYNVNLAMNDLIYQRFMMKAL